MEKGFIQDMLDVKVLVLFVMSKVMYPIDLQKIYELSFQDDRLSYFDLAQAVPQLVESGHLEELDAGCFTITPKGRETCAVTEDSIAYPVMLRAQEAVDRYNRQVRRSSYVKTEITQRESGDYSVLLTLNDDVSDLLRLELMAPSQKQAYRIANSFQVSAETIYRNIMDRLLSEPQE